MKDNEKKALLFVGIVSVIALPYFFYSKQAKIDTETLRAENDALQTRYDQLLEMNANREFYLSEIDRYNMERDAIIAEFPGNIDQAKYTMFLLNTEYSSITKNEETDEYEWVYPLRFDAVGYGVNVETEISSEEAETGFIALTNTSTLTYRTYYDGFKYMLDYLMEYEDPMIYRSITAEMDNETGVVTGSITLAQYAVEGEGRPFDPVTFESDYDGFKMSWDLDNYGNLDSEFPLLDLRGNEEVGIFGPVIKSFDDLEEENMDNIDETEDGTEDAVEEE